LRDGVLRGAVWGHPVRNRGNICFGAGRRKTKNLLTREYFTVEMRGGDVRDNHLKNRDFTKGRHMDL